jgi:hypothetical protein
MTQEQFLDLLPTIYSDTGKPSLMGAAVAGENARPGITAYHGSPHDFDKFSLDKIGTGEGAQAYGHGLYFAENEGVAKGYRDALSPDGLGVVARGRLRQHGGDIDKTIEYLRSRDRPGDEPFAINNRQALAELERAKAEGMKQGRMYQVRINANPEDFIDWDKPLSQQPKEAEAVIWDHLEKSLDQPGPIFHDVYEKFESGKATGQDMVRLFSDPEKLSQKLREAGIPGIKYLDQGSRTAGEGSRNYVVFDPATIEILRKYGLLGLMSGSVAAGAMPQQSNALYGGQ